MASLTLHLQSNTPKSLLRTTPTLSFSRPFSSSTSQNPSDGDTAASAAAESPIPENTSTSARYFFNDVKARLKQSPPQQPLFPQRPSSFNLPPKQPSKITSFEEIGKKLSGLRARNVVPSAPQGPGTYNKNMAAKRPEEDGEGGPRMLPFDAIRNSLRQIGTPLREQQQRGTQGWYNERLKLKSVEEDGGSSVIGGTNVDYLPRSIFGKEMKRRGKDENDEKAAAEAGPKTEFYRPYSVEELGEKLKKLRPDQEKKKKGENLFSLTELNERLTRLREMEEKESLSVSGINHLRLSLLNLNNQQQQEQKELYNKRLNMISSLGKTPMLAPPKEHLVEKYFHPDNMSSEEKMKIELKRVRDEFKMSESDCGSTRVQIAQLTTEIKHLSAVLHKKDKHSRRGLLAKVQKRKRLLKYLRRTDWDSYCLVLSNLGLRDNPAIKELAS